MARCFSVFQCTHFRSCWGWVERGRIRSEFGCDVGSKRVPTVDYGLCYFVEKDTRV
jgi:hypothetical protein